MKHIFRPVLLCALFALADVRSLPAQRDYAAPVLAGISNHGRNGTRPYVTAGDRAYLIGTQDGAFPDMGGHLEGEMGGLWMHPVKLIDGFWAAVTDERTNEHVELSRSAEFINYPYGNRFRYAPVLDGIEIERFQFSPESQPGVVVRYTIRNATARRRRLRIQLSVNPDLRPVWFSERLGIIDARDTVAWSPANDLFVARDTEHPWFCVWGAVPATGAQRIAHPSPVRTRGASVTAASSYRVALQPHGTSTLTFVFAGSTTSRDAAVSAYRHLASHIDALQKQNVAHYAHLIDRARIRIPDQRLREVYDWSRVNMEWLVRSVPGIGRGLSAGLMEYPWWFGTETYSLQALAATGDFDLAKDDLRLLNAQSMKANGNGRIVHEVTTNGGVVNHGNTQETAQFIMTVGRVVDWSGDMRFAREMYPAMTRGIDWLLTDMDQNRDLFPEGYGITEILGLNSEVIDVAVYTQQALEATAHISAILGKPEARHYEQLAAELKSRINRKFWIESIHSYGDFFGTAAQAVSTAQGSVKQIELKGVSNLTRRDSTLIHYYEQLAKKFSAMPDTGRAWLTNENWVITTPMEVGIAPRARAIEALDEIRKANVGEYGPYLSAVDREAMMTIATGAQAVSEGNYGRSDEALWYMNRIVETFNRALPGSMSEMMPDDGCFTIAWTSYGIVIPIIQQFFGIRPDALHKSVVFEPHLPTGWDDVSVEDLPVGTNAISFSRAKTARGIEYDIDAREGGWNFVLRESEVPGARYYLNGRPVPFTTSGIRMSGRKNRLLITTIQNSAGTR
jgi:glycogen debranching enzyme